MRKIVLDLSGAQSRGQMHELLAESFSFPDWYGRNLDALYDCLTDIFEDTCAGIYGMPEDEELKEYGLRIRRTCEEAEEENPHLCFFFFPQEE